MGVRMRPVCEGVNPLRTQMARLRTLPTVAARIDGGEPLHFCPERRLDA
jgi:hypothetical protein